MRAGRESPSVAEPLPARWSAQWADHSDEPALVVVDHDHWRGRTISNGELAHRTAATAIALAGHGVAPGDHVLWSAKRSPAALVAALAILRMGAVLVPINPAASERELGQLIDGVKPGLAVMDDYDMMVSLARLAEGRRGVPAVNAATIGAPSERSLQGVATPRIAEAVVPVLDAAAPGDPALVVHTSGTTGRPKGAVLTHGNLAAGARSLRQAWHWTPEDRLVLALPLFHVHGLVAGLFGSLAAGGCALVFPRFDPGQIARNSSSRYRATMFFGVPTMYHRLAKQPRIGGLAALRLCVSGSAALAAALWREIERLAGVQVLERYGMTETLLTVANPYAGERRPGTVGFALPDVRISLHETGELRVSGPTVFAGYLGQPQATAERFDGEWFRTGDLASMDEDGYVTIHGRASELIISGGFNVYPAEVEDVLLRHPSVAEVAVTGVPSAEWGEQVVAWVVPDGAPPRASDLLAFAADDLASYKRPREVRFVDALPRNEMGKVQRQQLG